jgi:hypothetical protein
VTFVGKRECGVWWIVENVIRDNLKKNPDGDF